MIYTYSCVNTMLTILPYVLNESLGWYFCIMIHIRNAYEVLLKLAQTHSHLGQILYIHFRGGRSIPERDFIVFKILDIYV